MYIVVVDWDAEQQNKQTIYVFSVWWRVDIFETAFNKTLTTMSSRQPGKPTASGTKPKQVGPREANLVLVAYASSEGSGEPAHPRSLARTSSARSYKQWVKRYLQTESQIPGPSEWLGMPQLKFVMTECSKTQIRLTRPRKVIDSDSTVKMKKFDIRKSCCKA